MTRSIQVNTRLTPEDKAKLEALCNHELRTESDMIRVLIVRAAAELKDLVRDVPPDPRPCEDVE